MSDNVISFPKKQGIVIPANDWPNKDEIDIGPIKDAFLKLAVDMHAEGVPGACIFQASVLAVCQMLVPGTIDPQLAEPTIRHYFEHLMGECNALRKLNPFEY